MAEQRLIKIFLSWRNSPSGPGPPHYRGFTITLGHTTLGGTPLDEWSARYLRPNVAKWNRRKFSRRCRVSNQHLYLLACEVYLRHCFW